MSGALDVMLAAPEFDLIVAVGGSSARSQPELLIPAMIGAAERTSRPLAVFIAPAAPAALAMLADADVPAFRTPESCADVIAAIHARRTPRQSESAERRGNSRLLDEAEGYIVLSRLGIETAPHAVITPDEEGSPVGYPVALKILSAEVLHKTDVGGVVLNVRDDRQLRDAMAQNNARHGRGGNSGGSAPRSADGRRIGGSAA